MGPRNKEKIVTISKEDLTRGISEDFKNIIKQTVRDEIVSYHFAELLFRKIITKYFWVNPRKPLYPSYEEYGNNRDVISKEFYNFQKSTGVITENEQNANFEFEELINDFRNSIKRVIDLAVNESRPEVRILMTTAEEILLAEKLYADERYMEQKFVNS